MGFFSRLFRKSAPRAPEPPAAPVFSDPDLLRDALFKASDDVPALRALCTANRTLILQHFDAWRNVQAYPGFNPQDPVHFQYVLHGLTAIAAAFRDGLNEPALWDRLAGPGDDNPFQRFEETFGKAKELARDLKFGDAIELLTGYLIDSKGLAGPGADNFRAYAHGLIGICLFQSNRANDALSHLQQALTLCTRLNDAEGVRVYLEQLYDAHRYLGQPARAAEYADRLATACGQTPDAGRWRAAAARVRQGEPPLRMVVEHADQRMELDEFQGLEADGAYRFLFERNRPTLRLSLVKTEEGKKAGASGKFDDALDHFRAAAKADPFDPDPHYQAGLTLMLLERYGEAVDQLERVAALAPGWFHAATDLWLAEELLAGRIEHPVFVAIWIAESGSDAAERLKFVESILVRRRDLPHLHLARAGALLELGRKAEAIRALEAGIALKGEPDVHSRLLAQRAGLASREKQRQLYGEILTMPEANPMARAMACVVLGASSLPQK
jgi:tetratricopeptide (TPR) repeat protein